MGLGRGRIAAALFASLWLAACQPGEPLRVGFIGGVSGRWSDLGIGARNGAQLAVEELSQHGERLDLLVEDVGQNPERAAEAVRSLAQRGVGFVVGPMTGSAAQAMVPALDAAHLVAISPTSTGDALSGRDDHFFRLVADARAGGRDQADELWRRGVRSVATLADERNRAFSLAWVDAHGRRFEELGGKVAARVDFDSGAGPRYAELARRLLDERPDAVLIAASAVDTALISQQLRSVGHPLLIASSPWAGTEQLIELGGAAVEGALVGQYFDRDSRSPRYLQFAQRYRERFGEEPGYAAVKGYEAVTLGVTAWRRRGPGQTLRESLLALREIDGLQQRLQLDAHGDVDTPLRMATVTGNRFGSSPP